MLIRLVYELKGRRTKGQKNEMRTMKGRGGKGREGEGRGGKGKKGEERGGKGKKGEGRGGRGRKGEGRGRKGREGRGKGREGEERGGKGNQKSSKRHLSKFCLIYFSLPFFLPLSRLRHRPHLQVTDYHAPAVVPAQVFLEQSLVAAPVVLAEEHLNAQRSLATLYLACEVV